MSRSRRLTRRLLSDTPRHRRSVHITICGHLFCDSDFESLCQCGCHRTLTEVLLRQCEFLPDRIIFKDSKRKVELWLDAGLLEGLAWDSTWNHWKQWLTSRIAIASDFVETPKVHFEDGERVVTSWWIALTSRISATTPASLSDDIESERHFTIYWDAMLTF
jgi:hypothetical protein